MKKAVILAAGRGSRMRQGREGVRLSPEQASAADRGLKALVPLAGRPLLDHTLEALGEVGIRRVCLVLSPQAEAFHAYLEARARGGMGLSHAVQPEPRGTADALLAAAPFCAGEPFLLLNSDTWYPPQALAALAALGEPGLLALDRTPFLAAGHSNIPAERLAHFAVVQVDGGGHLAGLLEKPDPATYASLPEPVYLNINAWRFPPAIFAACRAIPPSPRGELELPDAVLHAIHHLGERFRVLPTAAPVLDLTARSDIPEVEARLREMEGSR